MAQKNTGALTLVGLLVVVLAIVFITGMISKDNNNRKTARKITQKQKQIAIEKTRRSPKYLDQMQKQLGPDWKLIKLTETKWYGPYKTRSGSGFKIAQGEIWVKVGDSRAFLDKPGQKNTIGRGSYMFYPKTSNAIAFYKY